MQIPREYNSGADFFGCRPGTDSLQLAQAISKQPNLLFSGLTSEVPAARTVDDISLEDSAISALLETAFKIQSKGMECSFMHLRTHSVVSPSRIPTGWHISMPFSTIATMDDLVSDTKPSVSHKIIATIIARPSLQGAVVDCGTRILQQASEIVLAATNERLAIKQMDQDRCVLDMSAATTELSIGQQIQFSIGNSAPS